MAKSIAIVRGSFDAVKRKTGQEVTTAMADARVMSINCLPDLISDISGYFLRNPTYKSIAFTDAAMLVAKARPI